MVTTGAIIYGDDHDRFLGYNNSEHPLALQLGGSNPTELAKCALLAQNHGYDEINLNVGCPSDRVQNNMIGACLMAHPELVSNCLSSMRDSTDVPVTIKHRIGIDNFDRYEFLRDFVSQVGESGCTTFIVHARIAILEGLSPKENREIPPLKYDYVYRLKQDFPEYEIVLNGGIKSIDECKTHLEHVDGVMVGREAYQHPWLLSGVDSQLFGKLPSKNTRHDIIRQMYPYIEQQLKAGQKLHYITRHMLGLFHACPGGKQFRRYLSENAYKSDASLKTLEHALTLVPEN
jgi:tRNA-dihydrouridine synthase A